MKKLIRLTVNDDPHELYIDTRRSLLDVLRHALDLLGAHRGCDAGDCGACTIHVNGLPVTSCMMLAADYDGADITTVEGGLGRRQDAPCTGSFGRTRGYSMRLLYAGHHYEYASLARGKSTANRD